MAGDAVAQARALDKLNAMFPALAAGDGRETDEAPASRDTHSQAWEALWADATFLPWERGAPHPALHEALTRRADLLGTGTKDPDGATHQGRRKALVPGCGRGYDVFMLRSFGFDVLGIDISTTAVENSRDVDARIRQGNGPGDNKVSGVGYAVKDPEVGEGQAEIKIADFFTMQGQFDLIFDYTFLSALPPSLRPQWAASMARLLSPTGRLVCVEFPTQKPTDSGGPPWATPEDAYVAHLRQPGVSVRYDDKCKIIPEDADRPVGKGGLERIARWAPERSHEAGQGTDRISIWRHAA